MSAKKSDQKPLEDSKEKIKIPESKTEDTFVFSLKDDGENNHSTKKEDSHAGALLEELPESVKKKLEESKVENKAKKVTKRKSRKLKEKKHVPIGKAYINATYNNTIVTLADNNGNVLAWASAGAAGFKGPKKSTSYASQIITRVAVEKAKGCGLQDVNVLINGVGTGREAAIRTLNACGLNILSIKDVTPVPHNGCRARKPRRV